MPLPLETFGAIESDYMQYAAEIQPLNDEALQESLEIWQGLQRDGSAYAAQFIEVIHTEIASRMQPQQ